MNIIIFALLISVPITLFIGLSTQWTHVVRPQPLTIAAYLALSSCLGDRFRASYSPNPQSLTFGGSYLRTMTNSGPAMSEQIEMESMLHYPAELEEP